MDEQGADEPTRPQAVEPAQEHKLSAALLPYDDERLWVGMSKDRPIKGRSRRRRRSRRPPVPDQRQGVAPARTSRIRQPVSFGRRRIAAVLLTLALPISAFAVTVAISGDSDLPSVPAVAASSASPTPAPSSGVVDIPHLHADRVTSEQVRISWKAPEVDEPLTYVVHRDTVVVAETTATHLLDSKVKPQSYYHYWVTATLSDGTVVASQRLLVAVPSDTGALPEGPAPSAPSVTSSAPSPTPSQSPSPSKSKVVWPSTDSVDGTRICTSFQTTDPAEPCYSPPPLPSPSGV